MHELKHKIFAYLAAHNAMSLSTTHDGRPHAATVFYINRRFDLYFISNPSSRHGQDLAINNRVSATINEDYKNWLDIKGLQLEGMTEQMGRVSDNRDIADAFVRKFPDTSGFFEHAGELPDRVAEKVARVRFYRLKADKIFYIDNSLGFGHREELVPVDAETAEETS